MRSFEAIRGHLRSKWPILFSIATTSRLWTGTFLPRFLRIWIRYWQMDCCAMFLLISCSVENRRIFKNDRSADCQLTGQYMSKVIYIRSLWLWWVSKWTRSLSDFDSGLDESYRWRHHQIMTSLLYFDLGEFVSKITSFCPHCFEIPFNFKLISDSDFQILMSLPLIWPFPVCQKYHNMPNRGHYYVRTRFKNCHDFFVRFWCFWQTGNGHMTGSNIKSR